MRQFLLGRTLRALVSLWGVSTLVFVVMRLSGDPVALVLPQDAPPAEIFRVRHDLGLEEPLPLQYGIFMGKLAHGDFGQSIYLREPALGVVLDRMPATVELAAASMLLACGVALPIGVLAAVRRGGLADHGGMMLAMVGQSTPTFYLGIMMILLLSVQLHLFPSSGRGSLGQLAMPAITLGLYTMASIARITRTSVLDILNAEYVRTARAKGLRERIVVVRHVLTNAAIPIVTILGLQLGSVLGGAVVTETIFAWPGLGRLAIQSIANRDYPVVQAAVFVAAAFFIAVNFLVDVLYSAIDPRLKRA